MAEAIYGPFSRSNDYASQAGPSTPPQDVIQDVEMEDFNDMFDDDVMVYYHAALSSSGSEPVFDITRPTSDHSQIPPPGSIELAEMFAKASAQKALNVGKSARKGCSKVVPKVGKKAGTAFPLQTGCGRTIYSP